MAINGVAPTEENIRNGTYPYIVDAYMVTRENPTPETQKFVDWFISQQGQQLVEDVGYVPLYEASRIIRTIMMNIIRLYIYPLFLGFVIVPLLVWPMVVALAACIITLSFLGNAVLNPAHDQAYFTSAITTLVIG